MNKENSAAVKGHAKTQIYYVYILGLHIELLVFRELKQCGMTVKTARDPAVRSDTLPKQANKQLILMRRHWETHLLQPQKSE